MACMVAGDTELVVHKFLVQRLSGYMDEALDGCHVGEVETLKLASEDAQPLQTFITWVYSGQIMLSSAMAEKLWVFGEKMEAPEFQAEVMHLLFSMYEQELMSAETLHFVEDGRGISSPEVCQGSYRCRWSHSF